MFYSRRDVYYNESPVIDNENKIVFIDENKHEINESENKNISRENEFLRDFCEWRKSKGLFVPKSWEK